MSLGLIIGRFQPLHNGHLELINSALDNNDKVLILVGSAKQLPDFKNPFSYEERLDVLRITLDDKADLAIRPLPDKPSDDEWLQDVIAHVNDFEEDPTKVNLYCHPKDEAWYRKNLLYPINTESDLEISATEIRHAWYTDELPFWQEDIPKASLTLLTETTDFDRLSTEYATVTLEHESKVKGHPYGNPIEPVSFAVIIQGDSILLGQRGGARGNGQWGLPGGYLSSDETTLECCMRETLEELGVDLRDLITSGNAVCVGNAIEENLDDLGVRTLGVNYAFIIKPDVELDISLDYSETLDYTWVTMEDICSDNTLLFYNHSTIVKRLLTKLGNQL